jgi:iron complex outermembrane receptor protein
MKKAKKKASTFGLFSNLLKFLLVITLALSCGTVMAQEEGDEFMLEEIVVTGSRIVRRDFESNSPIVTIEAAQFEMQTGLNIESYLNQLPEYNPAASPVTSQGDVQITPINSVGVATISLRGFGANRNLNLIDGKRIVPVNAQMWTDINGIPSSMIERVETITGGASAVYGADAVGGVTNFIIRKDYEGFEFDGQYGIHEAGDGDESRVSMLFGVNSADGRGNVTFGAERYEREVALARERSWYRDYWADPDAAGYFFFLQGVNAYSCDPVCPNFGALKALYGNDTSAMPWWANFTPDFAPMSSYIAINFNPDGTIWITGNPTAEARSQIVPDGLMYGLQNRIDGSDMFGVATYQGIKWNEPRLFASGPQDRYSIYATGHYDLTDKISVFGGARFAESTTATLLFGTDAISGWEASVPYDPTTDSPIDPNLDYTDPAVLAAVAADPAAYFTAHPNPTFIPTGSPGAGHPVPAELAWLLNSRTYSTYCLSGTVGCDVDAAGLPVVNPGTTPTTDASLVGTVDPSSRRWQPQWFPQDSLPARQTYNTIEIWQIEAGLDFELPFRDWSGEVYVSHGQANTYNVAGGNMSLARYRALINMPDYGRNSEGTGNVWYTVETENGVETVNTIRPRFGCGDFTCTSGFYDVFFAGDQPLSTDCFNAVNAVLQTRTEMTQDILELNLQGSVVDLPAGALRTAVGYQYRNVGGKFNPDILQSEDSFMDQVVGVYPTGYMDAETSVNDYYIEALVPVLHNLPFMQKWELETGARYSEYRETGDKEWTNKILANWQVKDWLRLRGGYNRATRAPNIGELFLATQEVFGFGGNFGDPCSVRANAPWGAGGTTLAQDELIGPTEAPPTLAPGQTLEGADRTQRICEAMMGPEGADYYYRGILADGTDQDRDFAEQGAGGGFIWVLQEGNPDLEPETADTWTAGFVMSSPFANAWLSGITLAFDWYNIEIEDAIMMYSIDYANYRCFGEDTGLSPAEQAASPACQLIPRDQHNGAAMTAVLSYDNQATIDTRGFDIMLNWFANIRSLGIDVPGSLNFNVNATILDSYETKLSPAVYDVPVEWKGTLGPTLPGTQPGAYDYRLFTTLTYVLDNWSTSLRWRHLPEVWTSGHASQEAIIRNNAAVTAGGPGILLDYTPSTEIKTDSYNVFDLSATWDINETFSLRGGITNLFDTAPPDVGSSAGYPPGTDLGTPGTNIGGPCDGAPGCSNPQGHSLYSRGMFRAGYYDTLGRRFFLGLKARF